MALDEYNPNGSMFSGRRPGDPRAPQRDWDTNLGKSGSSGNWLEAAMKRFGQTNNPFSSSSSMSSLTTTPGGSIVPAHSSFGSFDPNVALADPSKNQNFMQRAMAAKNRILMGADAAGADYQRATGLGGGTAGGAAQASLLRALGAANAETGYDEMFHNEQTAETALAEANKNREFGYLQAQEGSLQNNQQLAQQGSQFQQSFNESQRQYNDQNDPGDLTGILQQLGNLTGPLGFDQATTRQPGYLGAAYQAMKRGRIY